MVAGPGVTFSVGFCLVMYSSVGCALISSIPSLFSAPEWHSEPIGEAEEIVGCASEVILCCCAVATQASVFRLVAATLTCVVADVEKMGDGPESVMDSE